VGNWKAKHSRGRQIEEVLIRVLIHYIFSRFVIACLFTFFPVAVTVIEQVCRDEHHRTHHHRRKQQMTHSWTSIEVEEILFNTIIL